MSELNAKQLLEKVVTDRVAPGNDRVRDITNRITTDLYKTLTDFDVKPDEFWAAIKWLGDLGQSGQIGLITAGLGFDRLIDMLQDAADQRAGLPTGTPRAIEGPLFIAGAPLSEHEARLDDEGEIGEPMVMEGTIRDINGKPVPNAVVDVWHANDKGRYSSFDPDQEPFHLRRKIKADKSGNYRFRSVLPPGYSIPPDSPTSQLFTALGRHGNRPAHIHFLVSAAGHRALTTQVNLPGDPFLDDDFAYATRDELVVSVDTAANASGYESLGMKAPFKRVKFDFKLQPAQSTEEAEHLGRAERVA
ncbi:MAG: dioxygenase [Pseudomonadota bacterium]